MKVAQSCLTLCDHRDCRLPGSCVHGILQARYWSGLPMPSPGDLPNPGIESRPPALQVDSLPSELPLPRQQKRREYFVLQPHWSKTWIMISHLSRDITPRYSPKYLTHCCFCCYCCLVTKSCLTLQPHGL